MTTVGEHRIGCDCPPCAGSGAGPGAWRVSERLAADPFGFFAAAPLLEPVSLRTPAGQHPTDQRSEYRYSRVRSTTTTFGLWVKIPVTFAILIWPLMVAVWDIHFGFYRFTPNSAGDFFFNAIAFAVCTAITVNLWKRGRV